MNVRDLILYLLDFNLDAEIVSDLDFGWTAQDSTDKITGKMETDKVYIYSDFKLPVEVEE